MKRLTPKQRVRKMYPTSACDPYGENGYCVVVLLPYGITHAIGSGRNRPRAWLDAARRLPK